MPDTPFLLWRPHAPACPLFLPPPSRASSANPLARAPHLPQAGHCGLQAKNERTKSESVMTSRGTFSSWGGHLRWRVGWRRRTSPRLRRNPCLRPALQENQTSAGLNPTFPTQVERALRIGPEAGKKSGAAARGRYARALAPRSGKPRSLLVVPDSSENAPPSRVKGRRRRLRLVKGRLSRRRGCRYFRKPSPRAGITFLWHPTVPNPQSPRAAPPCWAPAGPCTHRRS